MAAKLQDVAQKAGVSVTTVSRVINNYGYLSEKTKKKVFDAMRELNYQPNSLARSLQGKKMKLIGVIFPSITHPLFAQLIEAIEKRLFIHGYKIILCNAGKDKEKERDYLRMLQANQVDGIIAGAHNLGIEAYNQTGLPIVSFDRKLSDQVPIVSCDNYEGIKMAVDELIKAGSKKIYFLGNKTQKGNPTDQRLQAYLDKMKKLKMNSHICSISFSDSTLLKCLTIKQMLEKDHPDGIVCSDDLSAILVMNEARKIGLSIPQDLKVIGFDGTDLIQTYYSDLSTIAQPIGDIAALLVKLILKRIDNPHDELEQMQYVLPVKLISNLSTQ